MNKKRFFEVEKAQAMLPILLLVITALYVVRRLRRY